jgi:hypothetical protein
MKYYIIVLTTLLLGVTACEKEEISETNTDNITIANINENNLKPEPEPIFVVSLDVNCGTRITARKWGEKGCLGRFFCFTISDDDIVENGGVREHDPMAPLNDEDYTFNLNNYGDHFEFEVMPGNMSDYVASIVFEDNIFVAEYDYVFPEWVCVEIGIESCILPAGVYPVIEDLDGTVYFSF